MAKKSVFVSFDWHNDRRYKFLLEAWDANPHFEFVFSDRTPDEIDSTNIGRIKAALTTKINSAKFTLVIIGEEANKLHKDYKLIGYKNWIDFELHQSKLNKNKIVAVKLDKSYESPDELQGTAATWAYSFEQQPILAALTKA